MFKCIPGLAPHYLSNDVTMHVNIHGYIYKDENVDLYKPRCTKEIYKRSFSYKGSSLWNELPTWVKESTSLHDFKHDYRLLNGWIHPKIVVPFTCTPISYLSILFTASPIWSYPELISILSWYCCFYAWFLFMDVYICVLYIYIFYFVTGHHGRTV